MSDGNGVAKIFLSVSAFISLLAQASISPFVPAGAVANGYLEKLEALGCAYPTLRVLGPQTHSDLRSAVDSDLQTVKCEAPEWLLDEQRILARRMLPVEVRSDGFAALYDRVTLPGIPASLWPTFALRENRPSVNGINLSNELFIAAQPGASTFGFALSAMPGLYLGYPAGGPFAGQVYLQEAHVKVGYGFSEFSLGRYARRFGDTKHGSVLFSGATAPLDVLEFAVRPIVPAGILSHLGPVSLRTWGANQGADAAVAFTWLWGTELGLRPFHWWELAASGLLQFDGQGAVGKRTASLAIHTGFWAPSHFGKAYGQLLINRLGEGVLSPLSGVAGVWLPSLSRWDLRLEYARTAQASYQHPIWPQGLTYRGSTLGHPLGPDGEGVYLDVGLPPLWTWWHPEVGLLYEARSVTPTAARATQVRYGMGATIQRRWGFAHIAVKLVYHQVHNAQYKLGQQFNVFAGGMVFRYSFL